MSEWARFSNMLTASDSLNYSELQFYVDSLPMVNNTQIGNQLPFDKNKTGNPYDTRGKEIGSGN